MKLNVENLRFFCPFRLAGKLLRDPVGGGLHGVPQGDAAGQHQTEPPGRERS